MTKRVIMAIVAVKWVIVAPVYEACWTLMAKWVIMAVPGLNKRLSGSLWLNGSLWLRDALWRPWLRDACVIVAGPCDKARESGGARVERSAWLFEGLGLQAPARSHPEASWPRGHSWPPRATTGLESGNSCMHLSSADRLLRQVFLLGGIDPATRPPTRCPLPAVR